VRTIKIQYELLRPIFTHMPIVTMVKHIIRGKTTSVKFMHAITCE
jgi:glycerol-3-phosphate dehydrogenase